MRPHGSIVGALVVVGIMVATSASAASLCFNGQPNRRLDPGEQCDLGGEDANDCCDNECRFRPLNGSCDDDNACTSRDQTLPVAQRDHCDAIGHCIGGAVVTCSDGNDCTTDVCHPNRAEGHQCTHANQPAGTSCDDAGDQCCSRGVCSSGGECVATDACAQTANPCDADAVCNPDTCQCVQVAPPSGQACDDHDACTVGDTCSGGACVPGAPRVCDDGEICTQDVCDNARGCVTYPYPDATDIECGSELGECRKGVCQSDQKCHFTRLVTEPGVPCTGPATDCKGPSGFCSTSAPGTCETSPVEDGRPCAGLTGTCRLPDDATCVAGRCETPSLPNGTPCDDGNPCSAASECQFGGCDGTVCDADAVCPNAYCQSFCGVGPPPLCGCVPATP